LFSLSILQKKYAISCALPENFSVSNNFSSCFLSASNGWIYSSASVCGLNSPSTSAITTHAEESLKSGAA